MNQEEATPVTASDSRAGAGAEGGDRRREVVDATLEALRPDCRTRRAHAAIEAGRVDHSTVLATFSGRSSQRMAVPATNKEIFRKHAAEAAFKEFGATRIVECWGDRMASSRTRRGSRSENR
jgi:hypothetical protein